MMDSPKPEKFFLRSTSTVSLNERFSQVLVDQLTCSRMVTFDPVLQQRAVCGNTPVVLLAGGEISLLPNFKTCDPSVRMKQQRMRRRSVWTRLGGQQVTRRCLSASRPRGFWSFRNKYRWRGPGNLHSRLGQRRLLMRRNIQKLTAERQLSNQRLRRGGPTGSRGRGLSRDAVPTKKQLDAQLEDYMSMSKSRLDKELDDYMSMSRRRLDAQLDEYMLMEGQTDPLWD